MPTSKINVISKTVSRLRGAALVAALLCMAPLSAHAVVNDGGDSFGGGGGSGSTSSSSSGGPGAQNVPEPAALGLFGMGLVGLALMRRRNRD